MSTITITLSGSALTGLTGTPSKSYTVSDADLQTLLNVFPVIHPAYPSGSNATILLSWIQRWVDETIQDVSTYQQQHAPQVISIS